MQKTKSKLVASSAFLFHTQTQIINTETYENIK